ncbi:MAG: hypothetical protein OEZ22_14955 [Spirochaetia bacterium]|nr:hypothetical protein [Spirochaetia bacterium]
MNVLKKSTTLGLYRPGFFSIQINKDSPFINESGFIVEEEIFFHEYIHYLQDISTTFGLINASNNLALLMSLSQSMRESGKSNLTVPIQNIDLGTHSINSDLISIYMGDDDFKELNDLETVIEEPIKFIESAPDLKAVKLVFKSGDIYYFGATCIMESMAALLEELVFGIPDTSQMPYSAASILAKHLCPQIGNNKKYLIALCDLSLMDYNPGIFFYNICLHFNKMNINLTSYKDIYLTSHYFKNDKSTNFSSMYRNAILEVLKFGKPLFCEPIHKSNYYWLREKFAKVYIYRKNNSNYIFDILDNLNHDFPTLTNKLMLKYGMPMVFNSLGKGWRTDKSKYDSNTLLLFKSTQELFDILYYGYTYAHEENDLLNKFFCSMYTTCRDIPTESGVIDITNEHCKYKPWERSKDDNLCTFAQIWKVSGLGNINLENAE